jgi:hypothetical protein
MPWKRPVCRCGECRLCRYRAYSVAYQAARKRERAENQPWPVSIREFVETNLGYGRCSILMVMDRALE